MLKNQLHDLTQSLKRLAFENRKLLKVIENKNSSKRVLKISPNYVALYIPKK